VVLLWVFGKGLMRGPYRQFPADESMIVSWLSSVPKVNGVHFNTSVAGLVSQYVGTSALVKDYRGKSNFLLTMTEYFFVVVNGVYLIIIKTANREIVKRIIRISE
jgi:hypothetical protein